MLRTDVLLNIFVETVKIFFRVINEKKVQINTIYLKYRFFGNIMKVFTVTFDQFKASFLNKMINFFQ